MSRLGLSAIIAILEYLYWKISQTVLDNLSAILAIVESFYLKISQTIVENLSPILAMISLIFEGFSNHGRQFK